MPIQPIYLKNGPNGLNWQCSAPKRPPGFLFFQLGVDYSIELIFIETYAPQLIGHNKIFLASVKDASYSFLQRFHIFEILTEVYFFEYFVNNAFNKLRMKKKCSLWIFFFFN